jgi:hypothetical protein
LEDGLKHYHVLLHRTNPYTQEGRYQTEEEALQIDDGVERMLRQLKVPGVVHCNSNEESLEQLWQQLKKENS